MKHELKIIIGASPTETLVFVDENPIGLIQDIKFHSNAYENNNQIEIIFPNLLSKKLDPNYIRNSPMIEQLKFTLKLFEHFPHVKITLQDLDFSTDN